MRKYIAIFVFLLFTILYNNQSAFADTVDLVSYDYNYNNGQLSGHYSYYTDFSDGVLVAIRPTDSSARINYYVVSLSDYPSPSLYSIYDTSWNGKGVSNDTRLFLPGTNTFNSKTFYYKLFTFSNFGSPYLNQVINYDIPYFFTCSTPQISQVFAYCLGLSDLPAGVENLGQGVAKEPINTSDLDFRNMTYTTGSPYQVSTGDGFLQKFLAAVVNGALTTVDKLHFYNQPYLAVKWENPPYDSINGHPVQYTITEYGHLTVEGHLLEPTGIKKTFLDTDAEIVVLDNLTLADPVFNGGALDFYNPYFDNIVSDYAISHIDSGLLNSILLNASYRVKNNFAIKKIKLQARYLDGSQEYVGAPTYIDFTGGTPVVRYGVTIDDEPIDPELPDGDWTYDVTNDYDVEPGDGDNYTYNNYVTNNYNYNYNYGDNHYDTDGFISAFWLIIKSVGTRLSRLPTYIALIFFGTASLATGFAPIILLCSLAIGVAVSMRIIELISGGK